MNTRSTPTGPTAVIHFTDTTAPTTDIYACKTCGYILNRYTDAQTGNVSWIHARTWEKEEHDPDPAPFDEVDIAYACCDFCNGTPVRYEYVGSNMSVRIPDQIHNFGSTYDVCYHCDQIVQSGRTSGLVDQLIANTNDPEVVRRLTDPRSRAHVEQMHTSYLATVTERRWNPRPGPPTPHQHIAPMIMPKVRDRLANLWANHQPQVIERSNELIHLPGADCGQPEEINIQFTSPHTDYIKAFCQRKANGLRVSDLHWISKEFTGLAAIAGNDLTTPTLDREQLPSPNGFIIWDAPIFATPQLDGRDANITAASWTLIPGGIWISFYTHFGDMLSPAKTATAQPEYGWLTPITAGLGMPTNTGELFDLANAPNGKLLRTLFATWFLLRQPGVADVTQATIDKHTTRSYKRAGRPAPTVRIVNLRKRPRKPSTSDGTTRKWKAQRFVRGHWRDQPYPSRGVIEPRYISEYLAGDESLPLGPSITGNTVKVLK